MNYCLTFTLCLAYAVVRYVVFGDVATSNVPSYIVNKACAFASIFALLAATHASLKGHADSGRQWFTFFKAMAVLHVFLSLGLFAPEYYPKLFLASNKLTLYGELTLLFGVLGMFLFASRKILEYTSASTLDRIKLGAVISVALHQFFLGSPGWVTPEKWPGRMPPITLICFLLALIIAGMQVRDMRTAKTA